jgi:hypothetical protein
MAAGPGKKKNDLQAVTRLTAPWPDGGFRCQGGQVAVCAGNGQNENNVNTKPNDMRYPYALIICCLMLFTALDGQSQSSKTFTYTGAFETYVVPTTGWYLLDVSGAQGGANGDSSVLGGVVAEVAEHPQL